MKGNSGDLDNVSTTGGLLTAIKPPRYAWKYLILAFGMNMAVYYIAPWINQGRRHYVMALPLDEALPLVCAFIAIYLLAYLQWGISYLMIAREGEGYCRQVVLGDVLAKVITLAIFLAIPTTMTRPEIAGGGLFEKLTALIYRIDRPENLFPSIHCLESWLACRIGFQLKGVPAWYKWVCLVFSLLVFASTLLVKQHVAVDVLGGIVVAEAGLFISGKCVR